MRTMFFFYRGGGRFKLFTQGFTLLQRIVQAVHARVHAAPTDLEIFSKVLKTAVCLMSTTARVWKGSVGCFIKIKT